QGEVHARYGLQRARRGPGHVALAPDGEADAQAADMEEGGRHGAGLAGGRTAVHAGRLMPPPRRWRSALPTTAAHASARPLAPASGGTAPRHSPARRTSDAARSRRGGG